jgi:glycosyltransferase involved in cell wall biosynthesis
VTAAGSAAVASRGDERPPVRAVAVVIPARDEEALVARCLASVEVAAARARALGVLVRVILVADDCRDRTAAVARAAGVRVIESAAGRVGAARARGVDAALAGWAGADDELWIACTDADSEVPPTWITSQIELADAGTDVVVGTVRPQLDDLSPAQVAAWRATRVPGVANGHVHGANLGVRADAYLRAGGFPAVEEHEDVDLVARLRALDVTITASAAGEVLTSGRRDGRTPGGYAGYLHVSLLERAARRERDAGPPAEPSAAADADGTGCDRPRVAVG